MKAALALLDSRRDTILRVVPKTMRGIIAWENIRISVAMALAGEHRLAQAPPQSVYSSVLYILGLGLEIGGHGQQAWLIPYKGKCTPMIGAQGKIELAYRSGRISFIRSAVAYEHDDFSLDLAAGTISHRPELRGDRGAVLCTWAAIGVKGMTDPLVEVLTERDFGAIQDEAKRKNRGKLSPAYAKWPDEMRRRSAINRALKRAPKSRDLMEMLSTEVAVEQGAAVSVRGDRVVIDAETIEAEAPALPEPVFDEAELEAEQAERERVPVKTTPQKTATSAAYDDEEDP